MLGKLIKYFARSNIPWQKVQIRTCYVQRMCVACATQKPSRESESAHSLNVDSCFKRYTPEESAQILHILNTLKLSEYQSYNLTKGRANKLIAWKNRNGPFQNIDDILLVDGFGLKVVDKFYQSLLLEPSATNKVKSSRSRNASFLTPALDAERRNLLRSCVSLRIGISSVTWARLELPAADLNSPCLLTHWQHYEISDKKLHLQDLVQRCLYVDHQIPKADCYVFENPQMANINAKPGSAEQQNINIQKSQIAAILSFAMKRRSLDVSSTAAGVEANLSMVFYLRRFLTARLFNHLVGTERVSSEQTILKMMRTHFNATDAPDFVLENLNDDIDAELQNNENISDLTLRGEVLFSNDLRQMFSHAERYHREFLGQALLLNLAFVRLALLQDPKSIALVTRQSNKNKELTNVEETN